MKDHLLNINLISMMTMVTLIVPVTLEMTIMVGLPMMAKEVMSSKMSAMIEKILKMMKHSWVIILRDSVEMRISEVRRVTLIRRITLLRMRTSLLRDMQKLARWYSPWLENWKILRKGRRGRRVIVLIGWIHFFKNFCFFLL